MEEGTEPLSEADDFKKTAFSRASRADIHMISQRLGQHVQDIHRLKLDKIPAQMRGSGHKIHTWPRSSCNW